MERKEPALISLLARLFIKPDPAREEPETRRAYGVLCILQQEREWPVHWHG